MWTATVDWRVAIAALAWSEAMRTIVPGALYIADRLCKRYVTNLKSPT